jgi:hypothetical protein
VIDREAAAYWIPAFAGMTAAYTATRVRNSATYFIFDSAFSTNSRV